MSIALILPQNVWSSAYGKVNSGNGYYKQSEFDKSLDKYREAQMAAPDNPVVYFNMGDALNKQGDYDGSNAEYSKALSAKDKNIRSKAYYNLGNNAFAQEKYDEAANCYKKALELNPRDMDAKYNLEYLLGHRNQPKPKQGKNDKNGNDKNNKNKQASGSNDKEDKDKNKSSQKKNGMSKEDAQRILQYYNDQEKNSADKRKMKTPEPAKTDEDW